MTYTSVSGNYSLLTSIDAQIKKLETEIIDILQNLDLSVNETKILFNLMIYHNSTAAELAKRTGIGRSETYEYLASLLSKGVVLSTLDRPQRYYSLPYKDVIDLLVKTKSDVLNEVTQTKNEYQDKIQKIIDSRVSPVDDADAESYQVVVGMDALSAKMERMISSAKGKVIMVLSDRILINFYQHSDKIIGRLKSLHESQISVKLVTTSEVALALFQENYENGGEEVEVNETAVNSNNPYLDAIIIPKDIGTSYVVVDSSEALIIRDESKPDRRITGFYTNSPSLISILTLLFSKLPDSHERASAS